MGRSGIGPHVPRPLTAERRPPFRTTWASCGPGGLALTRHLSGCSSEGSSHMSGGLRRRERAPAKGKIQSSLELIG